MNAESNNRPGRVSSYLAVMPFPQTPLFRIAGNPKECEKSTAVTYLMLETDSIQSMAVDDFRS